MKAEMVRASSLMLLVVFRGLEIKFPVLPRKDAVQTFMDLKWDNEIHNGQGDSGTCKERACLITSQ